MAGFLGFTRPAMSGAIMPDTFSISELEAFLDEALPGDQMARIENALRTDPEVARQLAAVHGRRDAGVHSLGEIWRRHRLSCPTREQLGSYLLGAIRDEEADYVRFHVEIVGCRVCAANLDDLRAQQAAQPAETNTRRRRYFQTSAGHLRKKRDG